MMTLSRSLPFTWDVISTSSEFASKAISYTSLDHEPSVPQQPRKHAQDSQIPGYHNHGRSIARVHRLHRDVDQARQQVGLKTYGMVKSAPLPSRRDLTHGEEQSQAVLIVSDQKWWDYLALPFVIGAKDDQLDEEVSC
jgi:hypothetical protein